MSGIDYHMLRQSSEPVHEGGGLLQQGCLVVADQAAALGRLEVPVEIFVGVRLGCIGWQEDQFDLVVLVCQPLGHFFGARDTQVVDGQEDFLPRVLQQQFEEFDEALRIDGALDDAEGNLTARGDRGDQSTAYASASAS